MIPLFVRGDLELTLPADATGHRPTLDFFHQNISVSGVTGLPWGPLKPNEGFGKMIDVGLKVPGAQPNEAPLQLRTKARITRERTQFAQHMGLRFLLSLPDAKNLASLISRTGFFPTEYLRKYPRIPSLPIIQTFPLKAIDVPEFSDVRPTDPVSFDVLNLSPNGILLRTENPLALDRGLGARLRLIIEPRGWFLSAIHVEGMVCRVSDDVDEQTSNAVRLLGVKFTKIDPAQKLLFLDLIKDIVEKMQKVGATSE